MGVEHVDDLGKIHQRAGEAVDLVDHDDIDSGRLDVIKPFSRGNLYQLLSNPLYVGEIPHKGQTYPGLHEPVVDRKLWDAVQAAMSTNTVARGASANVDAPCILTGLVFDETGDRLSPSHAIKAGVRYRYYVSHRLMNARKVDCTGWRLPAGELERPILAALSGRLGDEQELMKLLKLDGLPSQVHQTINVSGKHVAHELQTASAAARKKLLHSFAVRIEVHPDRLTIAMSIPKLTALLNGPTAIPDDADAGDSIATFDLPHRLKRRGVEARLIVGNDRDREPNRDNALISLIAQAHHWLDKLTKGEVHSIADLAIHENTDRNGISRFLPLAFRRKYPRRDPARRLDGREVAPHRNPALCLGPAARAPRLHRLIPHNHEPSLPQTCGGRNWLTETKAELTEIAGNLLSPHQTVPLTDGNVGWFPRLG